MRRIGERAAGFTLIEVLVAMTILAVGVGALVTASAASVYRADVLRDREIARWVATNRLTALQVLPQWPDIGVTNIETEMAKRRWHVRTRTQRVADADLRRVDVEVRLERDEDSYIYSAAGFVANPDTRMNVDVDAFQQSDGNS